MDAGSSSAIPCSHGQCVLRFFAWATILWLRGRTAAKQARSSGGTTYYSKNSTKNINNILA